MGDLALSRYQESWGAHGQLVSSCGVRRQHALGTHAVITSAGWRTRTNADNALSGRPQQRDRQPATFSALSMHTCIYGYTINLPCLYSPINSQAKVPTFDVSPASSAEAPQELRSSTSIKSNHVKPPMNSQRVYVVGIRPHAAGSFVQVSALTQMFAPRFHHALNLGPIAVGFLIESEHLRGFP